MRRYARALLCFALIFIMVALLSGCSFAQLAQDVAAQKIDAIVPPETQPTTPDAPIDTPSTLSQIAGTYSFYEISYAGQTIKKEDQEKAAAQFGVSPEEFCYLVLNEDGTGTFCVIGETFQMGWDASGIWPQEDKNAPAVYTLSGNLLTLEYDGMVITFQKEVISL